MEKQKQKQITFDIDTNVAKKILGEKSYTNIYSNIRKFMVRNGWKHIEGSVYMSKKPMSNTKVAATINSLKKQYPYLTKCIRDMHQSDISNVHGLHKFFDYDGTPGQYERKESGYQNAPPQKTSVISKLNRNKEILKQQRSQDDIESRKKSYDREL